MIVNSAELGAYRVLRSLLRPDVPHLHRQAVGAELDILSAEQRAWLVGRVLQERGSAWLLEHHRVGMVRLQAHELSQLQVAAGRDLRRTLEADALRRQLQPLLCGNGPQLLLLKGASIEQLVYPKGVMRPCIDVDVAVVPAQQPAVEAYFAELGLVCIHRDKSGRTAHFGQPSGGATLDLHLRLACPKRFPRYATLHHLEAAVARSTALADGTRVLAQADATLHLLVHLAAGLGGDLRHLADAAQWLKVCVPDAGALAQTASELGLARTLRAACTWLADLEPAITLTLLQALGPGNAADSALQNLQHRQVLASYLRRGPALTKPLSALTELCTLDFPRGALGLTAVTLADRLGRNG